MVGGLSRPLLVGWRIILPSACLACSAGNFCLLQKPDLFDLVIGTAADFVVGFLGILSPNMKWVVCVGVS